MAVFVDTGAWFAYFVRRDRAPLRIEWSENGRMADHLRYFPRNRSLRTTVCSSVRNP